MKYAKPVVGQCIDCGTDLHYEDAEFYPWSDGSASTRCPAQSTETRTYPHRLNTTVAEQAWAEFYRQTGQQPLHDVNHTYLNSEENSHV